MMPTLVRRVLRTLSALLGSTIIATMVPVAVLAAAPQVGELNPPPPDFYACTATGGDGAICRAETVNVYADVPTGIVCGTGPGAFEILDSGTQLVRATRYYDADGNIVRRLRTVTFEDTRLANPETGASITYQQRNTDWDEFTIPGDLDSSSWTGHGVFSVTAPGHGVVLHESGRTRVSPEGEVDAAGPSEWSDFVAGDTDVVADLCEVLG